MDPQSSNARNPDDVEFEDAEFHAVHDADEHLRNPTSDNQVLFDDQTRMEFTSLEQAYVFYQTYAKKSGFSARKGGEHHVGGIIKTKYFVCSEEGHKPMAFDDPYSKLSKPYKRMNKLTIRTGCKAQIKLCSTDGMLYKVDKFVQAHNHSFVCPQDMHLLPAYRHLSETQEEMIWDLGTLNFGPVKAFNIMRQIRLTDKKQFMVDYSFVHSVDESKRLTGLFWADGLCKRNYAEFGDVISFDATFKTNKYKMVFVPFTGIDNHCRNVTLGAGLLASESIESYKWLLQSFLDSFGKQPKVVVTDQDPEMKQAIEVVFDKSRHRLCMWHIMKKVADKVGLSCVTTKTSKDVCVTLYGLIRLRHKRLRENGN
ncbi:protein FAR1-RELATED SEQUENCE 5-like [Helianthus annuus]|uniref:protein FAR1-RELATED SEQUENCE 5-like n=1 Tax=Helianthus annuus TaxID=4232 RepID=UPI000B90694A|nr:protein FAR1-RELATED SEQUENCE 5-like [Helianthus annuus]